MEYILIRPWHGATFTEDAAAVLVSYALRRRARGIWTYISAEQFTTGGETMLLARPSQGMEVRFADWTLPFLHRYVSSRGKP